MRDYTTQNGSEEDRLVVKFGGSIISDRNGKCCLNEVAVSACVASLRHYCEVAGRLPIILLGGGSFAHPFAQVIKGNESIAAQISHAEQMDAALAELRQHFVDTCRAQKLPALPFREHDLFRVDVQGASVRPEQVHNLTVEQIIPVMTGGCFRLPDARYHLLSSDDLSALIHVQLPLSNYTVLTDVDGLIEGQGTTLARLIRDIPAAQASEALKHSSHNKVGDMTGGMKRKVANCARLVRQGVACYVGNGLQLEPDALCMIAAGQRKGTYFHPSGKPVVEEKLKSAS